MLRATQIACLVVAVTVIISSEPCVAQDYSTHKREVIPLKIETPVSETKYYPNSYETSYNAFSQGSPYEAAPRDYSLPNSYSQSSPLSTLYDSYSNLSPTPITPKSHSYKPHPTLPVQQKFQSKLQLNSKLPEVFGYKTPSLHNSPLQSYSNLNKAQSNLYESYPSAHLELESQSYSKSPESIPYNNHFSLPGQLESQSLSKATEIVSHDSLFSPQPQIESQTYSKVPASNSYDLGAHAALESQSYSKVSESLPYKPCPSSNSQLDSHSYSKLAEPISYDSHSSQSYSNVPQSYPYKQQPSPYIQQESLSQLNKPEAYSHKISSSKTSSFSQSDFNKHESQLQSSSYSSSYPRLESQSQAYNHLPNQHESSFISPKLPPCPKIESHSNNPQYPRHQLESYACEPEPLVYKSQPQPDLYLNKPESYSHQSHSPINLPPESHAYSNQEQPHLHRPQVQEHQPAVSNYYPPVQSKNVESHSYDYLQSAPSTSVSNTQANAYEEQTQASSQRNSYNVGFQLSSSASYSPPASYVNAPSLPIPLYYLSVPYTNKLQQTSNTPGLQCLGSESQSYGVPAVGPQAQHPYSSHPTICILPIEQTKVPNKY